MDIYSEMYVCMRYVFLNTHTISASNISFYTGNYIYA